MLGFVRGRIDRDYAGATVDQKFGLRWDNGDRVADTGDRRDRQRSRQDSRVTRRTAALGDDRR